MLMLCLVSTSLSRGEQSVWTRYPFPIATPFFGNSLLQSQPKAIGALKLYHVSPIPHNQCCKISRFFPTKKEKKLTDYQLWKWAKGRTYFACPNSFVWNCSYSRHLHCIVVYYWPISYRCLYPQLNVQKNVYSLVAVMRPLAAVNERGRFWMIIRQCAGDVCF